jgi:hypothetical protein
MSRDASILITDDFPDVRLLEIRASVFGSV